MEKHRPGLGWNLLSNNKLWIIGDGTYISFWDDNWLGIGAIRSYVLGPMPANEHQLKLCDLWNQQQWNLNRISFSFPTT